MKNYLLGLIVSLLFGIAPLAHAWNDAGHATIAVAAFEKLPVKIQRKFILLLEAHPRFKEDFFDLKQQFLKANSDGPGSNNTLSENNLWLVAMASAWPDLARHFSHIKDRKERDALVERYHRGRWHYVNHPLYLTLKDEKKLAIPAVSLGIKPPPLAKTMNLVQALAYAELKISSPRLPAARKAVYLCWWLHLMGDLHQPLHNVAMFSKKRFPKGDKGGNAIRVGKKKNLHQLWDGAIARQLDERPEFHELPGMEAHTPLLSRDRTTNYSGWSFESARLAANKIYSKPVRQLLLKKGRLVEPDPIQVTERSALARHQAAVAVNRMAYVLNNISK